MEFLHQDLRQLGQPLTSPLRIKKKKKKVASAPRDARVKVAWHMPLTFPAFPKNIRTEFVLSPVGFCKKTMMALFSY